MSDSDFWRELAEKFRVLDPTRCLRFQWVVISGEEWRPQIIGTGESCRTIEAQFKSLATRAGLKLKLTAPENGLERWCVRLRNSGVNDRPSSGTITNQDEVQKQYEGGTMMWVCGVSADLCSDLETQALEEEETARREERERSDPRNWSPLRSQFEAFKAMKATLNQKPERIPEDLVRGTLAQQYGVKPEEVTLKQIQFEVSGLLRDYPRIEIVPTGRETSTSERDIGKATDDRRASAQTEALGAKRQKQPRKRNRRSKPRERSLKVQTTRQRIDSFIAVVFDATGAKIQRADIWKVAGYKDRTEFHRFQRDDPKTTKAARANFDRVLALKPERFVELQRKLKPKPTT